MAKNEAVLRLDEGEKKNDWVLILPNGISPLSALQIHPVFLLPFLSLGAPFCCLAIGNPLQNHVKLPGFLFFLRFSPSNFFLTFPHSFVRNHPRRSFKKKAVDQKKEEFRKYLEKTGVIDALTKGLFQASFSIGGKWTQFSSISSSSLQDLWDSMRSLTSRGSRWSKRVLAKKILLGGFLQNEGTCHDIANSISSFCFDFQVPEGVLWPCREWRRGPEAGGGHTQEGERNTEGEGGRTGEEGLVLCFPLLLRLP